MAAIFGFIKILFGLLLIYMGALQIVCGVLPKEQAKQVAYWHGKAIRAAIIKEKTDDNETR